MKKTLILLSVLALASCKYEGHGNKDILPEEKSTTIEDNHTEMNEEGHHHHYEEGEEEMMEEATHQNDSITVDSTQIQK